MKLDPEKLKVDESRSNPMRVAMCYPDCPIDKVCVDMAVGFGTVLRQCEYLDFGDDKEAMTADCNYDDYVIGG